VGESVLVAVLCFVGLVLGITLGKDKTVANTDPQPPTTDVTVKKIPTTIKIILLQKIQFYSESS
jgi:hypothetical protein